jgi:hypothetical protein
MRIAAVILLLFGVPAAARAQTLRSSIFVEGALFADRDTSFRQPTGQLTPGGGATIGGDLTSRFSIRFDVEIPTSHIYAYDYMSAGVYRLRSVTSRRTVTYAALFGWHALPRGHRVDLALLAGLSAAAPESGYQDSFDTLAKDGSVVRHDEFTQSFSSIASAVALGADLAVPLTARLSVVPEVRLHTPGGYPIARSKVAIRWTF